MLDELLFSLAIEDTRYAIRCILAVIAYDFQEAHFLVCRSHDRAAAIAANSPALLDPTTVVAKGSSSSG